MAFATKYPYFDFFLFHYFLVPLADTVSAEPPPESLQLATSCLCRGARHSDNLHLIPDTAFANCAIYL